MNYMCDSHMSHFGRHSQIILSSHQGYRKTLSCVNWEVNDKQPILSFWYGDLLLKELPEEIALPGLINLLQNRLNYVKITRLKNKAVFLSS